MCKEKLFDLLEELNVYSKFPRDINEIQLLKNQDSSGDITEKLLSSSYSDFCFDPEITKRTGFTTFESINEVSSGNNDLCCFDSLVKWSHKFLEKNPYHLSNYSGGRGDYFALEQLAKIENEAVKNIYNHDPGYSIKNLCMTYGGQGAYSAIASFLEKKFNQASIVFSDSTYCSNYKPFSRKNIKLQFIPSASNSMLPGSEMLLQKAETGSYDAFFLVDFHNPGGELYSDAALEELVKILKRRNKYLIFSEAFSNIYFGYNLKRKSNLLNHAFRLGYDKIIRVKTASKDIGLAGLRAGWMFAPEEICSYVQSYNDEIAYNAPMANNPFIIASSYFWYRLKGGQRIDSVENWMGKEDCEEIFNEFKNSAKIQLRKLRENINLITTNFYGKSFDEMEFGKYYENEKYGLIIPEGGFNICLRIPSLDPYDQVDIFRKVYIETGVILHSSKFIFKKNEYWVRITIAHSADKLKKIIEVISRIIQEKESYKFKELKQEVPSSLQNYDIERNDLYENFNT